MWAPGGVAEQEAPAGDTVLALAGATKHLVQLGHGPRDMHWHGDIKPNGWSIPKRDDAGLCHMQEN